MKPRRRSPCPVACTLDLLGDKWTLLVVRDLMCGKTKFKDFAASPERIATNTLADRLSKLVDAGLVERSEHLPSGGHPTYRLTDRGRALEGVLVAIAKWGLANVRGTEARLWPAAVPKG